MWSLPDIKFLNDRAAANAASLKREAKRKRKPKCEHWNCKSKATRSYLTFDIFSADPKGILHLCEAHDGNSGNPTEGYFTCAHCERVVVENHTWEYYRIELDGETVCLNCAAEKHFGAPENWLDPRAVKEVILAPEETEFFDAASGVLNVAKCRHVLAVKQPVPVGVRFVDNAEFDSGTGQQISGDRLLDIIHRLDRPFIPVLDAAYQFAVSIGIYVRTESAADLKEAA
jgi:hypothetical protein